LGTLLHWACIYQKEKIVSLLVSKKPSLSEKFSSSSKSDKIIYYADKTPLEIATIKNNYKIVLLIVRWPIAHKMLPIPIQQSIQEILCIANNMHNVNKKDFKVLLINAILIEWFQCEQFIHQ